MSTLLTRFDPIESLFRDFWRPAASADQQNEGITLRPRVDVHEGNEEYVITMDLPGVKKDDLHVAVENGTLTVTAHRKAEERKELRSIRTERYSESRFVRSFTLGEHVDVDKIKGKLDEGVLTLTVPKAAKALPRRIEVQ
jgi:HSP20 family protein